MAGFFKLEDFEKNELLLFEIMSHSTFCKKMIVRDIDNYKRRNGIKETESNGHNNEIPIEKAFSVNELNETTYKF